MRKGAELAVEEINAAGGVLGRKLEINFQDTTGAPAQAVQLFGNFARNPDVVAILGPLLAAEVGALTTLAESNKIVIFAPASAGNVPGVPDLKFNDWTFRINQSLASIMGPLLKEVARITGAKSVTILNVSDAAAYVDAAEVWQKTAEDEGMKVQRIQFPGATQDYSAIVTQVEKSTELIALSAPPATDGPLIRAIRQAGLEAPFVGEASIIAANVFTVSQGASKGSYAYSSYVLGAGTGTDEFVAAYKKVHGSNPTAFVAYGYEAIKLMADAMTRKNEVSRQALRDGLGETKNYEGVTGTTTYDNSGDAIRKTVPLVQVQDDGEIKKVSDIPLN